VNDTESVGEAVGAASLVTGAEVTLADLTPAVDARLVDVDDAGLRFRHPLVRSAIRQAASVSELRHAQSALASVLPDQPDRRAWHLAASTIGADEAVAADLDAIAARARRRGSMATTAAALERAAQLSEDDAARTTRLLQAGELAFQLGRQDEASRLVRAAEPLAVAREDLGRIALVREMTAAGRPRDPGKLRALVHSANELSSLGHRRLARGLLGAAAACCYWTDPGKETRETVVEAVERMNLDAADPWRLAIMASAAPIECGALVIHELAGQSSESDRHLGSMLRLATAALCVGVNDLARPFLEVAAAGYRAEGRLGLLAQTLSFQAWAEISAGGPSAGIAAADEAVRLARETSQPLHLANSLVPRAIFAGLRGDEDSAQSDAIEAEQIALSFGASSLLNAIHLGRGLTALGARRYDEAYSHLRRTYDERDPSRPHLLTRCWAIGSLAEAAIHSGHREAARGVLSEVEQLAELTPASLVHAARRARRLRCARCQSLERASTAGAPCVRGVEPSPRPGGARRADSAGTADRAAGRNRTHQSRDWGDALPLAPHDQLASLPDVSKARHHLQG
jgi:hypothetical protein